MGTTSTQAVVALVGPDDAQRALLRKQLDLLGQASAVFGLLSGFSEAVHNGQRFNLLVLAWSSSDVGWDSLAAMCDAAGVPILLVVKPRTSLPMLDRSFFIGNNVDFVTLPGDESKFYWRAQGMLARSGDDFSKRVEKNVVVCGNYRFLVAQRAVTLPDGRQIRLKPREFELALQLFLNTGRLLPRDWLWSVIWGRVPRTGERTLDVCVSNVRRALDLRAENGLVLNAVYKRGYRLHSTM